MPAYKGPDTSGVFAVVVVTSLCKIFKYKKYASSYEKC